MESPPTYLPDWRMKRAVSVPISSQEQSNPLQAPSESFNCCQNIFMELVSIQQEILILQANIYLNWIASSMTGKWH